MNDRRVLQEWLLILAAIFAVVWAVIRALLQSITIDEAFTYLYFVDAHPFRAVLDAGSNNHILNSLLMWITTHVLGTSNLTVRAPALLGAVLYVCASYFLCKSITDRFSLRLPLFICLTYNPFIFDFMVAARGYSLADGFLVAAIAVPVWNQVTGRPSFRTSCALASLALGLSFSSNFSFGFVDGAAFVALATWAIRRREGESVLRIAGFCVLPGLCAALLLSGYAVTHWHKNDLVVGSHSFKEMRQNLVQASFYQLAPRFRGSWWYKVMDYLRPRLPPLLIILCCCQLAATRLDGSWLQDTRVRWLEKFAAALAGILTLTLTLGWLAFHFYGLLLPLGRTGIFLVPLCTLLAGAIAGSPARTVVSQWLGRGLTAVFVCLALYFVLCLRLSYFKEYEWDADIKDVYSVMARINHAYGVTDVEADGIYITALNYYRVISGRETFPDFVLDTPAFSPGRSVYVIDRVLGREFIAQQKLEVVYRGNFTDVVVAVPPGGRIPVAMVTPE